MIEALTPARPVVALTLGDAAGIGPELIARLLALPEARSLANLVLVADPWIWQRGEEVAGVTVPTREVSGFADCRARPGAEVPALMAVQTLGAEQVRVGEARGACGASSLRILDLCMDAALRGEVDAICFAPLNKFAMKLGGLKYDDELHHFAHYLGVTGYFCEFNTLDGLWTSRISSHVPLLDVPRHVTRERILAAAELIHRSLRASGVAEPRVAVAGLNPHNGDGGTCGREEIDIIIPAVAELRARGLPIQGPYPADTIFLKARDGELDAVVTMYHDQGQIAIKLMGFSRGVTVQGGLPVPITTPAHGTAYDIAGRGRADVNATLNALRIAARMGRAWRGDKLGMSA